MARRIGDARGTFGEAISNMVADAVHKVIVHALPHVHAARVQAGMDAVSELTAKVHEGIAPMARECLDAGVVHDVLKPLFRILAGDE